MTTPGDLSARLHNLICRLNSGPFDAAEIRAELVSIAALSALPAGGEGCGDHDHANFIPGCPKCALTLPEKRTTPPADAHPDDGCLDCLRKERGGPADAAVGAQGEEHAIDRMITRYLELEPGEQENGVSVSHKPTRDFCRELLRAAAPASREWRSRLVEMLDSFADEQGWLCFANGRRVGSRQCYTHVVFGEALSVSFDAPAAGKGVDDANALAEFTRYFVKNYPGPDTIIHDPNWHAPRIFHAAQAALTRQPVAGDGANGRAWKIGDRVIWTSRFGKPFAGTVTCVRDPIPVRYEVELDDGALCDPLGHELTAAPTGPAQGDGEVAS